LVEGGALTPTPDTHSCSVDIWELRIVKINVSTAVFFLLLMSATATAAELPCTTSYALYKKRLVAYGWRPVKRECAGNPSMGKEFCGNQVGSALWKHEKTGRRVELTLWMCDLGWGVGALTSN